MAITEKISSVFGSETETLARMAIFFKKEGVVDATGIEPSSLFFVKSGDAFL